MAFAALTSDSPRNTFTMDSCHEQSPRRISPGKTRLVQAPAHTCQRAFARTLNPHGADPGLLLAVTYPSP
ncbi:hypothetical protein TREES_T100014126 [Tupaia chinensis]|uniref:Uncharacterized protein n=1 Tax=Tupaia chinensis TaxID=246437 RepID=L9KK15_TUPCH|nr:hypothetical protein TREES_T100014126 [Tupaia chinensis]